MKFGVGKKSSVVRKLTILFGVLVIFSTLDAFCITVYKEAGNESSYEEGLNDIKTPQNNGLSPQLRGVRSAEPSWSSLSGSLPSTNDYYGIDFGDVNNDGKLDVIAASGQMNPDGGIHCWLGDGNGGWNEQSNGLPTTGWYTDVEVDDLNNDGKLDIACGGEIYTGNGGEGGAMVWTQQNSPGPWNGVALGDIDNNGTIDIAAGTNNGVKVWTSNGGAGGTFEWNESSNGLPSSWQYYGVFLGDINNDGKLDLVVGNSSGGVEVWTGNGESGSSAVWTDASGTGLPTTGNYAQVCLGDANNDGKLDIAGASQSEGVRFWKGNGGEGGFSWIEESNGLSTSGQFFGLSFGDVNNDGKLDLVGANNSGGRIEVWLGDGGEAGTVDWTFAREGLPDGFGMIDICLGDVNNDGRIDIGATTDFDGIQVWAGNLPNIDITGWTNASTNLPTGSGWYDAVFGDVNHDGKLDLAATSNLNQGVGVWLGDGTGVWTVVSDPDLPSSGSYNGIRLADVDHDGNLDVIAASDMGGCIRIWPGDGDGGFGPYTDPDDPASPPPMGGVEVADINNDGDLDIGSCYYDPGYDDSRVFTWLGDGTGGFPTETGPPELLGYDDVAFGDVDPDGNKDMLATGHMMGYRFWLGDGTGGWTQQPPNGLPNSSSSGLGACFGDVNHDGHLDIAIASWAPSASGVRVFTSNGGVNGSVWWLEESSGLPTSEIYGGMELGDINCDGNLDILSTSAWSNGIGIALFLGNGGEGGSMIWTDARLPNLPMSGEYWGVAFGDVNSNGILDIAITSDNGIEVYITQTRPTYGIRLEEGWNLISLPLIQSNESVEAVFESIDGQYNSVYCFIVNDTYDQWKHFHTKKPSYMNDLGELNHTMGIWIYVTEPGGATLTVFGDDISPGQSILIRPGWNLVGYPSKSDKQWDIDLGNLNFGTDIYKICRYNTNTDIMEQVTDSDKLEVGQGYWMYSLRSYDIIWEVPL